MRSLIFCGVLLGSISVQAAVKSDTAAPDFALPGHDGNTYQLSKFKGQYVVLEWFNNDCPYVEKHYDAGYRNMQNLQQKWITKARSEGKNLMWLAIVSSAPGKQGHLTAEQAKAIRDSERKAHMTAILFDQDGKVGRLYDAKTTPHMYVIDPAGQLRYQGAIDDQPSARVASLKGASNHVDLALTSLFAGKGVATKATKPYGCSVKY